MYIGWTQFLSNMSVSERINSGLLLAAILTLLLTVIALLLTSYANRLQARSKDYSNYLDIMTRFSKAWRLFRVAEMCDKGYEFRELLNLIEASCHLLRHSALGPASKEMLKDYLSELIGSITENENYKHHLQEAISGERTFCEMKRFALRHDIQFPQAIY